MKGVLAPHEDRAKLQAFARKIVLDALGDATFTRTDPLAGTACSNPATVEGFARGEPTAVLMAYAGAGESIVFTQIAGRQQCFLAAGLLRTGGGPVIYEVAFRYRPAGV